MEFKSVEVKQEDWKIYIEGFASTPDIDSYDDIVQPQAFMNTMVEYMKKPLILLQHNLDKIIWKTVDYRIEENGLWIRVELFNDIDWTFKSIQEWMLWQFSIWFRAIKWEIRVEWDKRIREITELRLVEVSIVAFPANPSAVFTLSKSLKSFFDWVEELKASEIWSYEVKSKENEVINFEEEIKEEEIEKEVKEEEQEQEEPTEEAQQEETKTDDVETKGETPPDVTEVKSDEVKALMEEKETLENEIKELKETLEAKDEEIKSISESKTELEVKFETLENEVKDYLSTGWILETKNEKKGTQYYASYYKF